MRYAEDEDSCSICSGSGCKSCSEDAYSAPCGFCDDLDCDGSGYNCDDGHYQEYNLRGWEDSAVTGGGGA